MSAFTKLAPARVAGLMMGVFYLAIAGGNFIGGRLASLYGSMPLPQLFGLIAGGRHRRRPDHVCADAADQAADGRCELALIRRGRPEARHPSN